MENKMSDKTISQIITELNTLNDFTKLVVDNSHEAEKNSANNSEKTWELAYDLIFNEKTSRQIFALFNDLGSRLDYYDPDTTYKEDVLAFTSAFDEKMKTLHVLVNKNESKENRLSP